MKSGRTSAGVRLLAPNISLLGESCHQVDGGGAVKEPFGSTVVLPYFIREPSQHLQSKFCVLYLDDITLAGSVECLHGDLEIVHSFSRFGFV